MVSRKNGKARYIVRNIAAGFGWAAWRFGGGEDMAGFSRVAVKDSEPEVSSDPCRSSEKALL